MSFDLFLLGWLVMLLLMLLLWKIQQSHENGVLADFGFCLGFGIIVLGYAVMLDGDPVRRILVGSMGAAYAFRLGLHLFLHRIYKKEEDARYRRLRNKWGNRAPFYFFIYFLGQAVAITVFSIPLMVLMINPYPVFSLWELIGILVWCVSIIGEALADSQLAFFRADPTNKGKTCRTGLWRYSRHPNYFFESLHWCSYVVMSVGVPYGWLTLIGPVLMIWGLLKVTGIPMAEDQALASRGEDYRNYQRTTSAFIPWFPKKR